MAVNVLEELKLCGLDPEFSGDNEWVRVKCPFHEDSLPSLDVSTVHGGYNCKACGASGAFVQLIGKVLDRPTDFVAKYLVAKYKLDDEQPIEPSVYEEWHQRIWKAGPLLKALAERAVSPDIITRYQLGEYRGRITIPITNASGLVVNIRSYLPGATKGKMVHMRKKAKPRLFPHDQLRFDRILVTAGEIKALAAIPVLEPLGIGSVSSTMGETNWDPTLTEELRDKSVYIIMDVDKAGARGAEKLARELYHSASEVRVITLDFNSISPSLGDRYPNGGIDDFIYEGGQKILVDKIQTSEIWKPPARKAKRVHSGDPRECSVSEAFSSASVGERVAVELVVSAVDTTPYMLPSKVSVICEHDQKVCGLCPVHSVRNGESYIHEVDLESPLVVGCMNGNRLKQAVLLAEEVGIPRACRAHEFEHLDFVEVEDIRVSSKVDVTDITVERQHQMAAAVGVRMQANCTYAVVGEMHPHPDSQRACLVITKATPMDDDLQGWELSEAAREALSAFQPKDWSLESVEDLMREIAWWTESDVSKILNRRELNEVIDLTYHSVLNFNYKGRMENGWIDALIIGDSSLGKSRTFENYQHAVRLGQLLDARTASPAGILGGLKKVESNGKFFVSWGAIPNNDRGIICVDELKGLSHEAIGSFTTVRSSGIASIDKIETQRTRARTRKIWITNPPKERDMAAYAYPIDAIKDLIGSPEAIRRFTIAIALHAKNNDKTRKAEHDRVHGKWQVQYLRDSILRAWTLRADQIFIEEDALIALERITNNLMNTYEHGDAPLIDSGETDLKVLRIAAACAARTQSYEDCEGEDRLIVRVAHIEWAESFIHRCYDGPDMQYGEYSRNLRAMSQVRSVKDVTNMVAKVPYVMEFIDNLLSTTFISTIDISDWSGLDREDAQYLMAGLRRQNALVRRGRDYVKTPGFIAVLREMNADPSRWARKEFEVEPDDHTPDNLNF